MLSQADIVRFLTENGIKSNDTVLIHTSLKAIGPIEGGADGLIDAFCKYLHDGLFLVPTHTWANVNRDIPFYNVCTSVPCIGALPRVAAVRSDGVRSLHPTHSITAFGKRAASFVAGEETAATPAPPGGCWDRLYDERAKILLLGVGHDKNTYFHAVDERMNLPNRLNPAPFTITITDGQGRRHLSPPFHSHHTEGTEGGCSAFYPNYKAPLEILGGVTYATLGNALVYCCDTVLCTEIICGLWVAAREDLCVKTMEIPPECLEGAQKHLTNGQCRLAERIYPARD